MMNWVPSGWAEMQGLRKGVGQRISKEKRRFADLKPPTVEEAQALVSQFIAERGVTRCPSMEQRKEAWGMR